MRRGDAWTIAVLCIARLTGVAVGATPAADVTRKVAALVRNLDADDRTERDKAEKEILSLGAAALASLPSPEAADLSAEQRRRLRAILPRLWHEKLRLELAGSIVSLPAKSMKLSQAIASIRDQTGIPLTDLRAKLDQPVSDPTLELTVNRQVFWAALDQVLAKAGLVTFLDTDDHHVGFAAGSRGQRPTAFAGALRIEVEKAVLQRDFDSPHAELRLALALAIEPKLTPLLVELDPKTFRAVDNQKRPLKFLDEGAIALKPQPGALTIATVVRLERPARDAEAISELSGQLGVWLPAHTQEIRFDGIKEGSSGKKSAGGVTVHLDPITSRDGVWTFPVLADLPDRDAPAESHLRAALSIRTYLQKADGSRLPQNGGTSSLVDEPGRIGSEFLFVDYPGEVSDYSLIVQVPVGLTRLAVPVAIQSVPLP